MKKVLILLFILLINLFVFSQELIESNNQFTFKAFQSLNNNDKNLVFSPYSVTSAMAMTYIGARNNTFGEISMTFNFNTNINLFSEDYKNSFNLNTKKGDLIQFYNANSLWIQKNIKLESDFLNLNKSYFSASLNYVNFLNNPDKSRLSINKWVEKNTKNKITDLLKPSSIDNSTRLVLVNALYFNGKWKSTFNKDNNTEDNFQIGRKEFTKVVFMNRKINSWYYENDDEQILDIPYVDENYSLMIILPKSYKKIRKIEKKLDNDYYKNYITNKEKIRIDLSLPKFNIESEFDLNKTLANLGVKEAFTVEADFTGITENEKLYISKVFHKANISVDEEGTEAAAATAVVMNKTSMRLDEVQVNINKPFIYIIRNNNNNCIYFIGKVNNPNY